MRQLLAGQKMQSAAMISDKAASASLLFGVCERRRGERRGKGKERINLTFIYSYLKQVLV
jgi:hypothetical protein